jgi:Carboxypeptidase regulatory-like domain
MAAMAFRILFALSCLLDMVAFAQPAGSGVIAGSVVESASGDAVRKAIVTVTWHGTPKAWATIRTDGSGKFRFENLPVGIYDLRATKEGAEAIYGADSARETGENITLGDGETREGLKLRFISAATINGHVFDPDGQPAPQAQISLLRSRRVRGERSLENVRTAVTDENGEYHMTRVGAGQYYVLASTFSLAPFNGTAPADAKPPAIPIGQYYGGSSEVKDATALFVHESESVRGIDFHVTTETAARISGHLTGVPKSTEETANPNRRVRPGVTQVSLFRLGAQPRFRQGLGSSGPDWAFNSGWISPGQYRLKAAVRVDDQTYSVSQVVDAHAGINEITLALEPSVDLKGTLRVEGLAGAAPPIQVTLQEPGSMDSYSDGFSDGFNESGVWGKVAPDGHFTVNQVPAGEWDLEVNPPAGGFLKSARFGDQDVRFARLQIKGASEAALTIVLSMRSAKVRGEVDAGDGDAARAGIVLMPIGELHEFDRFYYGQTADDHGKFEFSGVAPGKYRIFAVERLAPEAFQNADAADAMSALFADFMGEVDLGEGASVDVRPKLIPLERARAIVP